MTRKLSEFAAALALIAMPFLFQILAYGAGLMGE